MSSQHVVWKRTPTVAGGCPALVSVRYTSSASFPKTCLRDSQSTSWLPVGAGLLAVPLATTNASGFPVVAVKSHFGLMPVPVMGLVMKKCSPKRVSSCDMSWGDFSQAANTVSWMLSKEGVP